MHRLRLLTVKVILFMTLLVATVAISHRAFAVGVAGLKGTITAAQASGGLVVSIVGNGSPVPPFSVVVKSTTCTNQFSFDGGATYGSLSGASDLSLTGENVYFVSVPFTHVKMTGCTAGDTWQVL